MDERIAKNAGYAIYNTNKSGPHENHFKLMGILAIRKIVRYSTMLIKIERIR